MGAARRAAVPTFRQEVEQEGPGDGFVLLPGLADGRPGAEVREGTGAREAQEQVVERPPLVLVELAEHLLAQGRGDVLGPDPNGTTSGGQVDGVAAPVG